MSIIHLHLVAALAALGGIAIALLAEKGTPLHRLAGRIGVACLVVTAVSSFWITARGHFSWIHILSITTLVNLPFTIWAARAGRIRAHKRGMLANAGGLVVAGGFAAFAPGRYLHGLLFG